MRRCVADDRILVVGYGNPLRGDDGLGPVAARALADLMGESHLDVVTPHQLVPELVDAIADAGLIIFVDARVEDRAPGSIAEVRIGDGGNGAAVGPVGHHQTPAALMAAVRAMYGRSPDAFVFSVAGAAFDFGAGLSAPVTEAVPQLVGLMAARIAEHRGRAG
jgi:hydrogenase maturation protease